jgi:arabinose-5-phosphate isomerase
MEAHKQKRREEPGGIEGPDKERALKLARGVLRLEAEAIVSASERIDSELVDAANLILRRDGNVIVTGIGKAGAVGRKLAGTLSSTGTPAFFFHPAEGLHGDLGMIAPGDVIIALSNSGETDELTEVLPAIRRVGARLIAMTGNRESTLARSADVVLDVSCEKEACPLGLAPTTSTTLMMATGDALAVVLMDFARFTAEEYARLHPSGALGRRLLLQAGDLMRTGENLAVVGIGTTLKDAMFAISKAQAGAACVVSDSGSLVGIVTDGDVRRHLLAESGSLDTLVEEMMVTTPKTIPPDRLAAEAMKVMEEFQIGEMPVLDAEGRPVGVLNLKDILRAGIV